MIGKTLLENIRKSIRARVSTMWMVPEKMAHHLFPMHRKSFLRRIQIMGKAQVPFSDAISELKKRAFENHEGVMFAALQVMDLRIRRGQDMTRVFTDWLRPEEIMLITAGDKRGFTGYVAAIEQVLSMGGATAEMQTALMMGIIEPVILIASIYALMLWMSGSFTGKLLAMTHVSPSKLTGLAHQFYEMGIFSSSIWAAVVPAVSVLPIVLIWWSLSRWTGERSNTGKIRRFLDHIPPYSVYKEISGAQWSLVLSTLAMAGYPYEVILQEIGRLSRPWTKLKTRRIERAFRKGVTLGEAMRNTGDWFPSRPMVQDILAFGDRTGFKETLKVLAEEAIKDTTRMVKIMAGVLRGLGYLFMFLALVWLYSAFNALSNQVQALIQASGH